MRAYPNPFTQRTGLEIPMTRTGDVRVAIYDVRGRRVRTLERDLAPVGNAVIVWDGRDETGADLPAGLYFARSSGAGRDLGMRIVKTR
jgi:flagellar hook assembly protein FlgD